MQPEQKAPVNFNVYSLSEKAVVVELGDMMGDDILDKVVTLNRRLLARPFPGLLTTVPAYTTLAIFFAPATVHASSQMGYGDCFEKVSRYLNQLVAAPTAPHEVAPATIVTIPVCYEGEYAPDMEEICELHNLTPQQLIGLHAGAKYKVAMIGFQPGFAYLAGMPELLATPRKTQPRKTVLPGSVGIAGLQTGIYPFNSPGGWQLIGRTPLTIFDVNRSQPALLRAGDEVVFKPVSAQTFRTFNLDNPWL